VRLAFEADKSSQRDGNQQSREQFKVEEEHCTSPPVGRVLHGRQDLLRLTGPVSCCERAMAAFGVAAAVAHDAAE
jgi:flavoprotein